MPSFGSVLAIVLIGHFFVALTFAFCWQMVLVFRYIANSAHSRPQVLPELKALRHAINFLFFDPDPTGERKKLIGFWIWTFAAFGLIILFFMLNSQYCWVASEQNGQPVCVKDADGSLIPTRTSS